ncbi:MAG: putative Ig domain-containing protein, partial [Thermoplasmatota archaeon]
MIGISDVAGKYYVPELGAFLKARRAALDPADLGLPPGVTLSPTGLLSGTPTGSGHYSYTVTGTNGFAPAIHKTFTTNDPAGFRPSTGTWYVKGGPVVAWGAPGDTPVAADYD